MSERYVNLNVRKSTRERAIKVKESLKFKNQDELVNRALDSLSKEIKARK